MASEAELRQKLNRLEVLSRSCEKSARECDERFTNLEQAHKRALVRIQELERTDVLMKMRELEQENQALKTNVSLITRRNRELEQSNRSLFAWAKEAEERLKNLETHERGQKQKRSSEASSSSSSSFMGDDEGRGSSKKQRFGDPTQSQIKALFVACKKGDVVKIQSILESSPHLFHQARTNSGKGVSEYLASQGHDELIPGLLAMSIRE